MVKSLAETRAMTQAEAGDRFCPFSMNKTIYGNCAGARCMAWRWFDREPTKPETEIHFLDEDLDPGSPEPERPTKTPAHWRWVPLTVEGEGDDAEYEGGYWEEPEEDRAKREAEALAARRGFCGMVSA